MKENYHRSLKKSDQGKIGFCQRHFPYENTLSCYYGDH